MKTVYTMKFGSHLYGTNTPQSDVDLKSIIIPDRRLLLSNTPAKNVVYKTNTDKNTSNTADDVDHEYVPIQILCKDFLRGQTYAYEMVYAYLNEFNTGIFIGGVPYSHSGIDRYSRIIGEPHQAGITSILHELVTQFKTSNVKSMTSYAMHQANVYSLKGERLTVVRDLTTLLKDAYIAVDNSLTIRLGQLIQANEDLQNGLNKIMETSSKYFRIGTYDAGQPGYPSIQPCLYILEKVYPFSSKVEYIIKSLHNVIASYGERAQKATADYVDWKAMMHAVRISKFALQVLTPSKDIPRYPLPKNEVEHLLLIKKGEVPIEDVVTEINTNLETLLVLSEQSTLPKEDDILDEFNDWLADKMEDLYAMIV